jgi:hypothetical protein
MANDPNNPNAPPSPIGPPPTQASSSGGFMGILKNRILPAVGPITARLGAIYGNPLGLQEEYRQQQLQMQKGMYGAELSRAQSEAQLAGKQAAVAPGSEEEALAQFRKQAGIQREMTPATGMVGGNLEMGSFAPNENGPGLNFLPAGMTGANAQPGQTVGAPYKPQKLGDPVPDGKGGYVQHYGNLLTGEVSLSTPVPIKHRTDKVTPDPNVASGFSYPIEDQYGNVLDHREAPAPQPYVGSTTTETREALGTTPQGQSIAIPLTQTSTKTPTLPEPFKGVAAPTPNAPPSALSTPGNQAVPPKTPPMPIAKAAGGPKPGGAPRVIPGAGKPASPKDVQDTQKNQGQVTLAIQRLQGLVDNADVISKAIDAGRISFAIGANGTLTALAGRGVKLTPQEAKFASDFQTMGEDINLLRGPTGATGFRGEEAFENLQAQRGRLAQNPQVFKGVLANTLASMKQLQQSNQQFLDKYAPPSGPQQNNVPAPIAGASARPKNSADYLKSIGINP